MLQENFLPEQAGAVTAKGGFGNDTVAGDDYGERIVFAYLPDEPGEPRVSDAGRYLAIRCELPEGDTGYGMKCPLVKGLGRYRLSCPYPERLRSLERKGAGKILGFTGKISVQGRKEPVELPLMVNALEVFPAHPADCIVVTRNPESAAGGIIGRNHIN
jgi:hypothetical protein